MQNHHGIFVLISSYGCFVVKFLIIHVLSKQIQHKEEQWLNKHPAGENTTESRHEESNNEALRHKKTNISLDINSGRSESLLPT